MNQKSSLREDPQFVSWVLTGNNNESAQNEEVMDTGMPWKKILQESGRV
jgi:hypothetical protein